MQALYVVGSVSSAMRAKRLLERAGIRAYVRKTEADGQNGCGYGLLVPNDSPAVTATLQTGGVRFRKQQGRESP